MSDKKGFDQIIICQTSRLVRWGIRFGISLVLRSTQVPSHSHAQMVRLGRDGGLVKYLSNIAIR